MFRTLAAKIPVVVLWITLLGAATAMLGQSTSQGAISGTVFDTTGAVIGGATVTLLNTATNAQTTAKSDASGDFNFPLVEPGTYTVTFAATGFGSVIDKNVVVVVGQPMALEPHMAAGSAAATVTVSADAAVLNLEGPDLTSELPGKAIQDIPVQNRRWSALALTTPGVVADSSGFGLISVHGMSTLLNDVLIDGADDNQAYFSEERGRTREGYSTSETAIREFQVNAGVYSAEYGRATGAVINSITKSGSNELHGELLFNDLDRGFGAYDPGSVSPTGTPLKPKDLRKIYGGSVGGALIKDKLFWFYTYNQLTHINPGIAEAKSYGAASTVGSFLEQPDATVTTCALNAVTGAVTVTGAANHSALDTQVCSLAYREGIPYAAAVTVYNNGVNSLLTDLGTVPRRGYQEINTPKLDWQVNSNSHASFLYHRLRWDAPGDVETNTSNTYGLDTWGEDFVKLDYGLAKLESILNPNISNELLYQYGRELNDEGQQPYSAYTLNNLIAPGGGVAGAGDNIAGGTVPYIDLNASNNGFYLGSPYHSYRLAYPDERKWQIEDVFYYQLGNQSLRMGGDLVHNYDILHQTPYYYGYYTYTSTVNFLSDLYSKGSATSRGTCNSSGSGVATAAAGFYDCYSFVSQDFGANEYAIATMDYAGFIQDNWKVTPQLTFEIGLRYDYQHLPAPTSLLTNAVFNLSGTQTYFPYAGLTNAPSDKNNLGPRLGFSYDLLGSGRTVIRGGYGIYYGRILNGMLSTAEFGSGSPNGQYATASTKPTTAGAPTFPYPFASGGATTPSSFFLAPNLQNPQVHEYDLQVQQQLGKGTVFQVSYLGVLGRQLPNYLDVNLAPPQDVEYITLSGGPANGKTAAVPTFGTCTSGSVGCTYPTGYINPNFTNITEIISNIGSTYNGMTVEVLNRSIPGIQFDGNYTWSHALDYNQNASSTTSTNNWLNPYAPALQNYGNSQFNVGNRFVGYFLYSFPSIGSGGPLKYVANGWTVNDSFQIQNGLPYSATIGAGYNSIAALNQSWNGVPSVYYIPLLGINTYQVPRATVDDLRLQKAFAIAERYSLELSADMYNAANHQNFSTTDINTTAYNFGSTTPGTGLPPVGSQGNPAVLTFSPQTGPGVGFGSHSTSNDSGFLYTPREFQIQALLNF